MALVAKQAACGWSQGPAGFGRANLVPANVSRAVTSPPRPSQRTSLQEQDIQTVLKPPSAHRKIMSPVLESTDAKNKLEDLSGITIAPGENPYEALIKACNDDPVWMALFR